MRKYLYLLLVLTLPATFGCQDEISQPASPPAPPAMSRADDSSNIPPTPPVADQPPAAADDQQAESSEPTEQSSEQDLPRPPILEDFQGAPQLSLFPRVGDYRPEDDSDRLPYWKTFIEHLVKVSGITEDQATGNRSWVFRSINTINSAGYFSPLAVEPQTNYQVTFRLDATLPEGATAGIGIIEFNEFLWIPVQYTEEIFNEHFRGSQEGARLGGTVKGEHSFTFTTGSDTRMIHLVLFREGTHDRSSVMFDDVRIAQI